MHSRDLNKKTRPTRVSGKNCKFCDGEIVHCGESGDNHKYHVVCTKCHKTNGW